MPEALKRKLKKRARQMVNRGQLKGKNIDRYVYGALNKLEKRRRGS